MKRCIHIDWLELYCKEDSLNFPHNADYFRRQGYSVKEREYGTPVYREMFTILDEWMEPIIEIRRNPKSQRGVQQFGVLDPDACHVRLTNRTCYYAEPVKFLQEFIERHGLAYQRISRIDICLDFERFDSQDEPQKFLQRYMAGRYAKINQANISCHGKDLWDGRNWNSISWGQQKSMIGTKLYNKTMELAEVHDKPYIRQAWKACGLVEDEISLTKHDANGKVYNPQIWRLEFSIKSGTRNWFVMEDVKTEKKQIRSVRNDLSCYKTEQQLLDVFWSLCDHYFHFKRVERNDKGELIRKDRCTDKILFNPKLRSTFFKLENVATTEQRDRTLDALLRRLINYQTSVIDREVFTACERIIQQIRYEQQRNDLVKPWPLDELRALQLLMARRCNYKSATSMTLEDYKTLMKLQDELF